MRRVVLSLFAACAITAGSSQSIENVKASLRDGKIVVTYDLTPGKINQRFSIQLFSSYNNFSSPLTQVTGDVGQNVTPGKEKKIEWNVKAEVDELTANVTFRVKAELIPFPFTFKNPVAGVSFRRGKQAVVQWEGGKPDQSVRLELYKGTDRITSFAETKNSGQYVWNLPSDLVKANYFLKLTSGTEVVNSVEFAVKSKIPLGLKLLPIVVVGGVVAAASGGGGGPEPIQPGSDALPGAPGPK